MPLYALLSYQCFCVPIEESCGIKVFLCGRYMTTKWQVRNKCLEAREKAWAWRHEWGGRKVYQLILDMSGFYVKSAQILASKAVSMVVCFFFSNHLLVFKMFCLMTKGYKIYFCA